MGECKPGYARKVELTWMAQEEGLKSDNQGNHEDIKVGKVP